MLKLFFERWSCNAPDDHAVMLFPFWGMNGLDHDPDHPYIGTFDEYADIGTRFFEQTDLEDADFVVLPYHWENIVNDEKRVELASQTIEKARQHGKKTIVFYWKDSCQKIPFDDTVVFRTSAYRSKKGSNEFIIPSWSEDIIAHRFGGLLQTRHKEDRPTISFRGLATYPDWRPKATIRRYYTKTKRLFVPNTYDERGHMLRGRAIKLLENEQRIRTSFEVQKEFFFYYQDKHILREEFISNMMDSDYVLCVRGNGNFSFRFYEALCCGRIPVFIDTDCSLPYDFKVNWKDYCVWVDEKDVGSIGDIIIEYHEGLSDRDFIDMQEKCRSLWLDRICPTGFFSHFEEHFSADNTCNNRFSHRTLS